MATSSRTLLLFASLAVAGEGLLSPVAATASVDDFPRAPVRTEELGVAPDGAGVAAVLTFDETLVPALLSLPEGGSLRVAGWPIAPGSTVPVRLTRHEVYAPDARIVKVDSGREVELPRSRLVFFWGPVEDAPGERVLVSVDPDGGTLRAVSMTRFGVHEMRPRESGSRRNLLTSLEGWRAPGSPAPTFRCGEESLGLSALAPAPPSRPQRASLAVPAPLAVTKTGVVAVDTDNELLLQKFGDDTAATTNYIANLFAQMNVIYERDLSLRLLQGYTILRVSTTADPWAQSGTGNADGAKLNEFSAYWSTHYSHVRRTLAMLLSGKQGSGNSASGIAWIGGLCSSGVGYSFSQVFKFDEDTSAWDVLITAHELGHNFGSPHTHCYADPKPDTCWSGGGAGCFSGTGSCPGFQDFNGVTSNGTLMSYCHILNCGNTLVFHPETLTRYLNGSIANATGVCLFDVGGSVPPGPTVAGVSPSSGALGGGTPVTITGMNFQPGATVAFVDLMGSSAGTSVIFQNASSLTAVTPAHAAGPVDVVVMNPDFQTGTKGGGFVYVAGPTVSSIAPNSGSTAGGTAVTISGSGFQAGAGVTIGGVAATGVVVATANSISATTGAHATGTFGVTVTNPDLTEATLPGAFFYTPPPTSTQLYTLSPCRVVDTRGGAPVGGPALGPSAQRVLALSGLCGIPADATSISVNITVVPAAAGFMTLFPGNGLNPGSSSINFGAGQVRANNAVLRLSTDGTGTIAVANGSAGSNHLVLDVNGFFR